MRPQLTRIGPTVVLVSLLCAAMAIPVLAAGPPGGLTVSTTEYLLVLDREQSEADIAQRLADAGFGQPEEVHGLPPRFEHYRLIEVEQADATTKAGLLAVDGITAVRPVYRAGGIEEPFLPIGQVVVKLGPGGTRADAQAIAAEQGCTIARELTPIPQVYVFNVSDEATDDVGAIARRIEAKSSVLFSHPSMLMKLQKFQEAPGIADPFYSWQWHLNNTGQLEGGVADADIDAPEAWTLTMGDGAVVAVIDDSIQRDHEDIFENYLTGYDFRDYDDDPSPSLGPFPPWDPIGDAHGVATSGLICARANEIGVRGVAPFAKLIGCRLGADFYVTDQDIADAFLFAEQNGAMLINNSWGLGTGEIVPGVLNAVLLLPDLISETITYVATAGRQGQGVLVLFSSGNGSGLIGNNNIYAWLPNVMAIGATLRDDSLTCYSTFGPEQSVVAPGGGFEWRPGYGIPWTGSCFESDITTTDVMEVPGVVDPASLLPIRGYNPPLVPDPDETDLPNESYTRRFNGTSAACPVASGVAALVFSIDPGLTAREVRNLMEHTADKVETDDGPFDEVTGHNEYLGHGRVNAYNAVTAAWNRETWPSPVEDERGDWLLSAVALSWKLPDWDDDGAPDEEAAGVLVVRGPAGRLNWHPTDGVEYFVGQEVATGIVVVANEEIESLVLSNPSAGSFEYAAFTRNLFGYYAWGRRIRPGTGEEPPPEPDDDGPTETLASIWATPMVGSAPLAVQFAGGGIAQQGQQFLVYNWDFGDGSTGSGPLVSHTYTTAGTYLAKLTATTSGARTVTAAAQIVVRSGPNQPPVARIKPTPRRGALPLVVIFEADATDDGAIVRYEWDFGDGSTDTGQTVEHVYLETGIFVVTLTVTDDMGAGKMVTEVVTVTPAGASDSTTAAATVPESESDVAAPLPFLPGCGAGATGAMMATLAILLGLTCIRRRW